MVVLYKGEVKPRLVPVCAIVSLGEKPAGVAVLFRRYYFHCWNSGFFNKHHASPRFRPIGPSAVLLPERASLDHLKSSLCLERMCCRGAPRPVAALDKNRHFLDLPMRI